MIPYPTEEDIDRILDDMDASGKIDYLNIPGIVDILKVQLKDEIMEHWKEDNRVALSYCADCGVIQFFKIEIEDVSCKHCGSKNTDFVSCLSDGEDFIPDDFDEPFDLKEWAKNHKKIMKENELKVL
jgi:hypothetical protein